MDFDEFDADMFDAGVLFGDDEGGGRGRGRRGGRPRRNLVRPTVDPLLGNGYLEFPIDSFEYERCDSLRTREVGGHDAIDWEVLDTLGEAERARQIIGEDTPWDRLFELAFNPTYRAITVEFLSSFTFTPRPDDRPEGDPWVEIRFRLRGQYHEMSLARFACVCGLYTEAETHTPLYTNAIWRTLKGQLLGFWSVVADQNFRWPSGKASVLVDPLYRYIQGGEQG